MLFKRNMIFNNMYMSFVPIVIIYYVAVLLKHFLCSIELINRHQIIDITHRTQRRIRIIYSCSAPFDLDTVMPGMSVYDFGDAVRFICNTASEDEPDIRRVYFDTSKFRAFCRGYLGAVKGSLTDIELKNLVQGAFSITIELASRFLDDYLTGDTYFKVNYPWHNLIRTRF